MGVFVQLNEKSHMARKYPLGYVLQENGCWDWVGPLSKDGYGRIWNGTHNIRAHRFVFEQHKWPIPDGLTLDHLCRNRACVNPDHLEPVSNKDNVLRGFGPPARNARKNSCIHGHPLDGTRLAEGRWIRYCKTCRKTHAQRCRERERAIAFLRARGAR